MTQSLLYLLIFVLVGLALPVVALTFGKLLRPHNNFREKITTYESGAEPFGDSRIQFHVKYYLFALLFVVFDVETLFLYPLAVAYNGLRDQLGLFILIELVVFLFFLLLGLAYAWKKKVLEWE